MHCLGEVARNTQIIRNSIHNLEEALAEFPEEIQITEEQITEHFFAPGVYVRQVTIPAGSILTGKIHKTKHVSIISCGHVTVATERGIQDIRGPYTFINEPGEKRALYVHETVVWTTIHPTDETDLKKIEELVIARDYDELA